MMKNNTDFKILIIDSNEDFSLHLSLKLKQYKLNAIPINTPKKALSILQTDSNLDLVLLNIDQEQKIVDELFQSIQKHPKAKIILLSAEDILEQRETYFKKGILDYHVLSHKLDRLVDDIFDMICSLKNNGNEKILIIDNDTENLDLLHHILTLRNYNVLCASTGEKGLALLQNNEISLLILDMQITDINSLDLLSALKDMYLLDDFVVLTLSNIFHPSIVRNTLKSGAKDVLKKPFLYEEFLLKTDLLINSSRTRKTTAIQKKEIENSLKRFKELLNSTVEAMFIFEKNICINCNTEAIKLLGYESKQEILNKHLHDIFSDISIEQRHLLIDTQKDSNFEATIQNRAHKYYQIEIKERNVLIDHTKLKIIALLDVSSIKKHERMLSQQTKLASMGEMIGNIAHQWRQPLSAISIAAGGIKLDYELGIENIDEVLIELDNIIENTKFLSATIENFQNFLKVDKITSTFDLQTTFQKTIAIIHANLKANKITIIENYYDNYQLQGIQNELVQVLLNIVNNASDALNHLYSKKHEKYIVVTTCKDHNAMKILIHDNAGGIPEEILPKIFEPYFTTKHQQQGTGLGLYMSHKIMEKMNGKIEVENKAFQYKEKSYFGALFILSFPL